MEQHAVQHQGSQETGMGEGGFRTRVGHTQDHNHAHGLECDQAASAWLGDNSCPSPTYHRPCRFDGVLVVGAV